MPGGDELGASMPFEGVNAGPPPPAPSDAGGRGLSFLRGGGEMGALMRAMDWSATPLGPAASWPQSLKTSVSICLDSGFPVLLWWGPELVMLYNDAYRPVLGDKHPRSMGQPGRECWPEIWDTIGPMLEDVLERGRTSYFEDLMLPLHRHGFVEECYFTFTYSAIRDESGDVGGVFCAVTELTQRVYGERQVALLRELAAGAAEVRSYPQASQAVAGCLSRNAQDIPFALLYLADAQGRRYTLAGVAGVEDGSPDVPRVITPEAASPWPVAAALASQRLQLVPRLPDGLLIPPAPRRTPPRQAVILPIPARGRAGSAGLLVAGLNPMRPLDDGYRGFLDLVASHISSAVGSAQAYEEARQRADALAELDRAKTTFFSNVSHEFRTPLTLMLGPTEDALRTGVLSREALAVLHRNELRLLKLVNTLLDFARIEAAPPAADFQPVDLAAATADLASTFRSAIERAGLRLVVDCPGLPGLVHVDPGMWEKIVLNLLSNALKFTFDGEVGVSLRQGNDGVVLTVRDTGVGIPADELPRIFDRFHRVRSVRGRSIEGTGIGLALVQELVRLHQGTIEVTSAPGQGTTFTVRLPAPADHLRPDRPSAAARAQAPRTAARAFVEEAERWIPGEPGRGNPAPANVLGAEPLAAPERAAGRILVADDNADMRAYLCATLGRRWTVEAVPDGTAAFEAARRASPDLVVSDVMMPGLDGFELVGRLRADPATREIPVILLSARAGEEDRVEGVQTGADDYLVKPFSARELVARVGAHLELSRMRREATRALRASEARFREVAEFAPVILWMMNADGEATYVNARWAELTGPLDRSVSEAWVAALHPDDAARVREEVDGSVQRREAFRCEYRVRSRDGGWRWVIDMGRPRSAGDGSFLGYVGSVVDITDRHRAEEALHEADRQKSQFLAVLSHELRNPLAPIRNSLLLLERAEPGSIAARRARDILKRQTEHLSRLVDDLLDITRITHGKVELQRVRLDAREVVRRACNDVRDVFEQRGVELAFREAPEPLWVDADGARLAQIIGNLLNNALKFTRPGGHVQVVIDREGAECQVRVRDTGVGIGAEDLDRIFDPFVQAPRSRQHAQGGMGIGLALVRELALRQGGSVRVASGGPGQGAEFVVSLPLVEPPPPPALLDPGAERGSRTLSILIVEDNVDAGATLADLLSLGGNSVRTVSSGRAGIEATLGEPPDVLICDIGLPDLSGHEVIRAVRASPAGRAVFAIALTGYAQPQDREEALAAGFDAHLPKPPAIADLERLLVRAALPGGRPGASA